MPTAWAMIGVRLEPEQLLDPVSAFSCGHNPPPEGNYCNVCGQEKATTWRPKPFLREVNPNLAQRPEATFDEIEEAAREIVYIAPGVELIDSSGDGETVLVAGVAESIDHAGSYAHRILDVHLKVTIKMALEPLGLWDAERYGLYALLTNDDE